MWRSIIGSVIGSSKLRSARLVAAMFVALVLAGILPTVLAQRVDVSDEADSAGYLVDGYGRSLYLNAGEESGASRCYDDCAAMWPPLLVRGEPSSGEDVTSSFLGTIQRDDGSTQLTYNGWPLYYYSQDASAGTYLGQGVDDQWYLVSPEGEPLVGIASSANAEDVSADGVAGTVEREADAAEKDRQSNPREGERSGEAAAIPDSIDPDFYQRGRETFASICAACHGQDGQGGQGARLVGNARLEDAERVADIIIHGFGYMPAVGSDFSEDQVAAVATYIRNSWGNAFGPVGVEEVREVR